MASVKPRTVNGRTRYDVRWREPDGRARRKTFTRKVDANAHASTVEADKLRGLYIDPDAGRITFEAYANQWMSDQTFEQTTREQRELHLRLHVFPVLGPKPLAAIKASTIRAWLGQLSGAESTKQTIYAVVSAILSAAVDDERIAKNPCKAASIKKPRPVPVKVVPWTDAQVSAVRAGVTARYRIVADLASGLGLRQGEVFGLDPEQDIDWLRNVVTVRRQVRVLAGNRLVFAPPKFGKTREVPFPESVKEALAAHLAMYPAQAVTLPWRTVDGAPVTAKLVLTSREHKAVNRNYFNSAHWHKAVRGAGMTVERKNGMHALRHYYASSLLEAGVSIKAVSEYLGHHDPAFTLRTYTHLMPESDGKARAAIDAARARVTAVSSASETDAHQA